MNTDTIQLEDGEYLEIKTSWGRVLITPCKRVLIDVEDMENSSLVPNQNIEIYKGSLVRTCVDVKHGNQ